MTNLHTQARDEADLLPCPFCGGPAIFISTWVPGVTAYSVSCDGRDLCLGAHIEQDEQGGFTADWPTKEQAAKAWNTRAAGDDGAADLVDALRKDNERLRYLLWHGWHEMNAIRARSGVPLDFDGRPQGVDEGYWSQTVDAMAEALGDDAKPWPPKATPHGAVTPETKGET